MKMHVSEGNGSVVHGPGEGQDHGGGTGPGEDHAYCGGHGDQ